MQRANLESSVLQQSLALRPARAKAIYRPLEPSPMFLGLMRAAMAYTQTGGAPGSQAHPNPDLRPKREATPAI